MERVLACHRYVDLAGELLGFSGEAGATFNIAIQSGAILAVLVAYWGRFMGVARGLLARDAGVRIIGGCCGTMPEHLRAMRHALETRPKGARPSLEDISGQLGAFSSASDGTGDDSGAPRRERRRGR